MQEEAQAPHIEPRWPVLTVIVAAVVVISALPDRIRLFPIGVGALAAIAVVLPTIAVELTGGRVRWLRAERTITLLFCLLVGVGLIASLVNLVRAIVFGSAEVSGLQLLASSAAVWVSNVLAFSLLYWQMDRGGPESRVNHVGRMPDWLFPQEGAPRDDVPVDWRPKFVDYLFLAYSTATAFSATDAPPLTSRAKLLMMLESTISLVTMVVTASRAINVLGS